MIRHVADEKLLQRVCLGNLEAMDFLANHWSPYVHEIDDIIDGERRSAEEILSTFARAVMVFSHPFYVRNMPALRQLVLNINNAYADSVAWEKSKVRWQQEWADHNRHAGAEMVIAVAQICGGYDHARAISQEQRIICHHEHHAPNGDPI